MRFIMFSAANVFKMNVVIPVNTTATVYIPSESENAVMENGQNISTSKDIEILGMEGKYLKVKVGSGDYNFQVATSSN